MTDTLKIDHRTIRFGVEIECGGIYRKTAAKAIQKVTGGDILGESRVQTPDGRIWKVVNDGSLSTWNEHLRCEIVSPILEYTDLPTLLKVVAAVRKAGAKVSEKCGIHIHIDAGIFDTPKLVNLAKLGYQQEALILEALGVSQSRRGHYSKPTDPAFIEKLKSRKPNTLDQLNTIWYGGIHRATPMHYDSSRYRGINFHAIWDKGTVEFRWFEATLDENKVEAYIQFILALAAAAWNARATVGRAREYNPASAKYDMRVFLLRLGMNGEEFKNARKQLLALMPGDAAFKNGRPGK